MKELKIKIDSDLPTLNEYIEAERSNRYAGALIKKNATNKCYLFAKSSGLKLDNELYDLTIDWFRKSKRTDVDNVYFGVKFILDGFVKSGLLKGDGRRFVRNIHNNIHESESDYCVVSFNAVK